MGFATLISFAIGTLLGGLIAWPSSARGWRVFGSGVLLLSSVPYFLVGIILLYLLAVVWRIFPAGGGLPFGMAPGWNWQTLSGLIWHGNLPALSIIIA